MTDSPPERPRLSTVNARRAFRPGVTARARWLATRHQSLSDDDPEPWYYDDDHTDCEQCNPHVPEDGLDIALRSFVDEVWRPSVLAMELQRAVPALIGSNDGAAPAADLDAMPLVERLVRHTRFLRGLQRGDLAWAGQGGDQFHAEATVVMPPGDALTPSDWQRLWAESDRRGLGNRDRESDGQPAVPFAVLALLYSDFWYRSLASWDGRTELETHLFGEYDVPTWLRRSWSSGELQVKWLSWYVALARGVSLRRLASSCGWRVPTSLIPELQRVPPRLSAESACMYADVLRLGGTPVEYERIRACPGLHHDPTEPVEAATHDFWESSIVWLARHRDQLTDVETRQILDWAVHRHTEAIRAGRRFSWARRTPASASRAARAHLEERQAPRDPRVSPTAWPATGLSATYSDPHTGSEWTFSELTSSLALTAEGAALQHCVASYAAPCARGWCAIVSLTVDDVRQLTIEVDPRALTLIQARGRRNRPPTAQESGQVSRWLRDRVEHRGPPQTRLSAPP